MDARVLTKAGEAKFSKSLNDGMSYAPLTKPLINSIMSRYFYVYRLYTIKMPSLTKII